MDLGRDFAVLQEIAKATGFWALVLWLGVWVIAFTVLPAWYAIFTICENRRVKEAQVP